MTARPLAHAVTVGALLVGASLGATSLAAQSRAELLAQARATFDIDAKMDLLTRAANPETAPLDSVWAVAVYDLASLLVDQDREELASVWLRWVARHGNWPIDRNWYAPPVIQAYDRVVPGGGLGDTADPRASTSWQWPGDLDPDAPGVVEATSSDPSVPVSVAVEGEGTVAPGGALSLDPGTYDLVAFAEGYDTTRVTREVLPGATTVLSFDLVPSLPAAVESTVANSLVRIRFARGGQQVCTNGVIARPGGLILTSWEPIQGAGTLEVLRGPDVYGGVTVAASDPAGDLAVLRLDAQSLPVLPSAPTPGADALMWSVHHAGCGPATSARSRVSVWPADPTGAAPLAALADPLPAEALGAPAVDRQGGLLGLVVGPDRVAPLMLAEELLREAVAEVAAPEEEPQVAGGGGFPIKWVGAGAAVVGVAALLLGGGSENGNGDGDTGGIVVTFPGGGP